MKLRCILFEEYYKVELMDVYEILYFNKSIFLIIYKEFIRLFLYKV